jgi:hypothetical protein
MEGILAELRPVPVALVPFEEWLSDELSATLTLGLLQGCPLLGSYRSLP